MKPNKATVLLLALLLAVAIAVAPNYNCRTVQGPAHKVFNAPNQLQALDMSNYFKGFNLQYKLESTESDYMFIPPLSQLDSRPLPNPVIDGQTRIGLSVLSSQARYWEDQGVTVVADGPTSFTATFGTLNSALNLVFEKQSIQELHDAPTVCFDVDMIVQDFAIVDCQRVGTTEDRFYILNAKNHTSQVVKIDGTVSVTHRKNVVYRLGISTYLLSATITDAIDPVYQNKTFVNVYKIDYETHVPSLVFVIDADSLAVDTLSITDIEVDSLGNIYLTDFNSRIIKFTFNGQNVSYAQKFPIIGVIPRKVATVFTSKNQLLVEIATDTNIIELDWSTPGPIFLGAYSIAKDINKIVDFQVNRYILMLHSDVSFYFYRLGDMDFDNLLYSIGSAVSMAILDQYTPQGVVVDEISSMSYAVSNGYLEVIRPQANTTVTVTASSGPSVKCKVEFLITTVDDLSKIYVSKEFPETVYAENPTILSYNLEEYFNGQNLKYSTIVHESVYYELQHIDSVDVPTPKSPLWETYPVSDIAFYRTSYIETQQFNNVTFELCVQKNSEIACQGAALLVHGGDMVAHSLFKLSNEYENAYVFAYTLSFAMKKVFLMKIGSIDDIGTIVIEGDFNITDVDVNSQFAFVTVRGARRIDVFNVGLDRNVDNVGSINFDSFTAEEQKALGGYFLPREVTISPVDDDVLFIRMPTSVAIVRVSHTGVQLLSSLIVDVEPTQDWKVIVGKTTMLVVRPPSDTKVAAVFEYGIYDIYRPIFMREIDLGDYAVVNPIEWTQSVNSNFVYLKTFNPDQNDYQLVALRLGKPVLSAIHAWIPCAKTTAFTAVDLDEDDSLFSLLETQEDDTSPLVSWKIYSSPTLYVSSKIQDNAFKKTVTFGFKVQNDADEVVKQSNLSIYNYKASIYSKGTPQNVTLPVNNNKVNQIIQEIKVDDLFTGSILSYLVTCPYCDTGSTNNIEIINKFAKLPTTTTLPTANQVYSFQQDNKLWLLTDTTIEITDSSYRPIATLRLPGLHCTNWAYSAETMSFIIYCSAASGQQRFLKAIPNTEKTFGTVTAFEAPQGLPQIDNAHKIVAGGNKLMVLDNDILASGRGRIRVFGFTDTTIVGQDTLDPADFDCLPGENTINDFFVVDTGKTNTKMLIVSISSVGLGYATFDITESPFHLIQSSFINFRNIDSIMAYQLDVSRYLRAACTLVTLTTSSLSYNVLVTSSHGEHLHLTLNFDFDSQASTTNFKDLVVQNVFSTYNSKEQIVLNTLQFTKDGSAFMLSYWKQRSSAASLVQYNVPKGATTDLVPFVSGFEAELSAPLSVPLVAVPFTSGSELHLFFSSDNANSIYNVSSKVYLKAQYKNKGDFSTIGLSAYNAYTIVTTDVPVNWNGQSDDNGSGGLKWYFFLIIALGVILILGAVLGIYIKLKKKGLQKDSLLTEASGVSSNEEV